VRELIVASVREHSRKPDEIYGRIEDFCAGPFVELFARQTRAGRDSWGLRKDEV
jgi:N6-adenosine-specific RNA methylase IME4